MPATGITLAAVAAGGVLGAEARYGLSVAIPHHAGQFPWSTLLINLTGSLLIGVLMAWLRRQPAPNPLLRPFLGVGVLGGYTTYSSFAVDVQQLLLAHRPLLALGYLAATVLGGAAAVWLAGALAAGP
ncbi:MAG TPA: fluoride efflux transporter CrcB, partial [Jatrophihabitans sp.]|nr:fluoride efflux transporter CrcB [Jatrophihabitans sp.]